MSSLFDDILAGVKEDVAARERLVSFKEVKERSRAMPPPRDAMAALLSPGCSLIAEVKRVPSERPHIVNMPSPVELAVQYEEGGAIIIACPTERRQFFGSLEEMRQIAERVSIPIMSRDFIVDPYQIHEARCYGADMVPLRVRFLDQPRLESLLDRVQSLGMTAIVEVQTPEEATRACAAGARVVGVNARDFATKTLNRRAFAEIVPGLPQETIKVALSGIRNAAELLGYASAGADAVVMGESLVTADSPVLHTRALVAAGLHPSCPRRQVS